MRNRRLLLGAGFIGVLAVVAVLLREHTSIEALVQRETQLRDAIAAHPIRSWLIGFGVYFVASLVPFTGGKSAVFGWLFGFLPAVVMMEQLKQKDEARTALQKYLQLCPKCRWSNFVKQSLARLNK